jgi:crotonobetainyl-CoA:carnitine CoA-transferase CaiB-like acyl-CoA transferase
VTGPLAGFRVLDLSAVLSGPLATNYLCDQGADVIKVEAFSGDVIRHTQKGRDGINTLFLSSNRGKRAIAIDLKTAEGIEVVKRIATNVDVVVQNFRPGAIERMGLGYDVLSAINPALVYCSISGFGSTGPYASKRVYDPVIQGLSGINSVQGGPDNPPQMIQATLADVVAAITAAQSITAALLAREKTGEGQHVTLAMVDAMIALAWPSAMIGNMLVDSELPEPKAAYRGNDLIFRTSDGFITVAAVSESEWQGLCRAMDREEWLQHERLNTPAGRTGNTRAFSDLLSPLLVSRPSQHWLQIFDDNGVPCGPILTCAEVPHHEQIIANELIEELDQPSLGRVRQSRPAAKFSKTPAKIQGPAPRLGEDSKSILMQFGFSEREMGALFADDIVR